MRFENINPDLPNPVLIKQLATLRKGKKESAKTEKELVDVLSARFGCAEESGSKTTNFEDGVKLAVTKPLSYSVQNDEDNGYAAAAWCSKQPVSIHTKYLSWKPSLNVKEYNALRSVVATEIMNGQKDTANQILLKELDSMLTTKVGRPQVKVTTKE